MVFSSNGMVNNIRVVSGLSDGLTERAIDAARKIKFMPAMKDGTHVSMWMELEYNCNFYVECSLNLFLYLLQVGSTVVPISLGAKMVERLLVRAVIVTVNT